MTKEEAYTKGMSEAFEAAGLNKTASCKASEAIVGIEKIANMFNFSDSMDQGTGGGFNWSSIVIPLLAAAAAGYVGYNARDNGYAHRSAFDNVKNYVVGGFNKIIRKSKPRPIYDIRRYLGE